MKDGKVMTEKEAGGIGAKALEFFIKYNPTTLPLVLSLEIGARIVNQVKGGEKEKNRQLVDVMTANILGKPYVPGGGQSGPKPPASPPGVDCSGGVFWSLRYGMGYEGIGYLQDKNGNSYFNGWNVPLLLEHLPQREISKSQLQPGNLIYVNYNKNWDGIDSPNDWDHVMMVSKVENGTVYVYSAGNGKTKEMELKVFENWALHPDRTNKTLTYNPVYKYTQINWQELEKKYRDVPKKKR